MTKHLQRDLDLLKKSLLEVGVMVEEATNDALTALVELRPVLAQEVIDRDREIDAKEVLTEEECLKVLALHQPVAKDLRFVITALKVNNDLERMGDQAVNIAERAVFLAGQERMDTPLDFAGMAEVVRGMVRASLDALVNTDAKLARSVGGRDDEVDALHRQNFEILQGLMAENPSLVPRAVAYLSASREFERIADLATNIAEDVVFMVEGEVIRHRAGEQPTI